MAAPSDERIVIAVRIEPLTAVSLRCALQILPPRRLNATAIHALYDGKVCMHSQVALTAHIDTSFHFDSRPWQLVAGELSTSCVTCCGKVARRRSMGGFEFLDLMDDSGSLQVAVDRSVQQQSIHPLALQILSRRGSGIEVDGVLGRTRSGELSLFASALRLRQLPPEPAALLKAARLIACAALDLPTVSAALGMTDELELAELVHALEVDCTSSYSALEADSLARRLSGRLRATAGAARRERPPRFASAELRLLESMGMHHSEWRVEACEELAPATEVASLLSGALAPERGLPPNLSAADAQVRLAYLHEKKVPQLRWMLRQARLLLLEGALEGGSAAHSASRGKVVDLGCGKGDFTLLLAAAMPMCSILGIDTNRGAITAANARAAAAGLSNVAFSCTDAAELLRSPADPDAALLQATLHGGLGGEPISLLVALHACGGLSDLALSLAARCGASCLVATCCFNKHRVLSPATGWALSEAQKDTLCRMADCVEPTIACAARRVIGNLRLAGFRASQRADRTLVYAGIRTFPAAFSRQNVVLAGKALRKSDSRRVCEVCDDVLNGIETRQFMR